MPSVHVERWINNIIEEPNFEIYWFDILNRGTISTSSKVIQLTNWKKRKIPYIKGEFFLSNKFPTIYNKIVGHLEVTASDALFGIIESIRPDVVHSFEMQFCSYPIIEAMNKFPTLKWIYSCWGSDLYYYKNYNTHLKKIIPVLRRINFIHTDCKRDYNLATELGFRGKSLGILPGGGGYKLEELRSFSKPLENRKIILVKGYQHQFGRALNVLSALKKISEESAVLSDYEIVVFGAHKPVFDFVALHQLPFKVFDRNELSNIEVLQLMGETLIYIGNNISDGMPNTLLESLIMGAFPIQSNPGNVTAEVITNSVNGILIENPLDEDEIVSHIYCALNDKERLVNASVLNFEWVNKTLSYKRIQSQIVEMYKLNIEGNR